MENKSATTAAPAALSRVPSSPIPAINPGFIAELVERAADKLTDGELQTIANFDDEAIDAFDRIHAVCEGIACLVAAEEGDSLRGTPPLATGCFQDPRAVFNLLTTIATFARRAEERARAAVGAGGILAERKRAAAGGFQPRTA